MGNSKDRPSRNVALLLATFTGCGVGHFYVGQKRRAVAWFGGISVAALVFAVLFPTLGRSLGYRVAIVALFGVLLLGWIGPIVDLARMREKRFRHVPTLHVFLFWIAIVIGTVAVRLTIRNSFVEAFKVPAGSMMPTILVGDHMFVDKGGSHPPHRGEVIVFQYPEHPDQDFVKRAIAMGGDVLEVKDGHPWINGWEVPHCRVGMGTLPGDSESMKGPVEVEYLDGEAYLTFYDESAPAGSFYGPYTAKPGETWVLGDNRNNSHDSRMWFGGAGGGVPDSAVKGHAVCTWLTVTAEGIETSRFGASLSTPQLPPTLRALQSDLDRCLASRPSREKTIPPPRH